MMTLIMQYKVQNVLQDTHLSQPGVLFRITKLQSSNCISIMATINLLPSLVFCQMGGPQ